MACYYFAKMTPEWRYYLIVFFQESELFSATIFSLQEKQTSSELSD